MAHIQGLNHIRISIAISLNQLRAKRPSVFHLFTEGIVDILDKVELPASKPFVTILELCSDE